MIEIKDQLQNLSEFIKRNNQMKIPVYPLKQTETAYSNQSRRILLSFLLNEPVGDSYRMGQVANKRWRLILEEKVIEAGYQLIEVEEE